MAQTVPASKRTDTEAAGGLDLKGLAGAGTITGLDVSPDGRQVVFGSTAGGLSQLYVVSTEGGEPRQITSGSERAVQPKWSPTGEAIAFLQDIGGDENYQVCLVGPDGGETRDLTRRPGKLHENHAWSWDGSRIAFVSNRDGQFDVYYVEVSNGEVVRVTDHPTVHHAPEFSPDGSMISFGSNRTTLRSNWDTFVVSLADGREWKVTEHEGEADEMSYYAGQSPVWSPDGRHILVASSVPGNYDIMSVDVFDLDRKWIASSHWDESNGKWSPDGGQVAYVVNEDGNLVITVKNLADGRSRPVSHREGVSGYKGMRGFGGDYAWTPDGRNIVYGYLGPTEAGSVWIVSAEGGEPRCLYSSLTAEIDRSQLIKPELVRYPSFDGREISAFLYTPPGAQRPMPAVVYPHGGPTGQSMNNWSPLLQYLVSRGYAILAPNFRGSTGYGREFQWLNRNDWAGADLRDVVEGANWLEAQGISDCIGITGGSYGGFMTLSAVTKYPDRWKAAASIYGIANLVTMYNTAREDMRLFQQRNIGSPEENPSFYYERSPMNFVDRITCPLLILQGERDPRVRMEEAEQMRERLEAGGKQYELVVYRHEGHGFSRMENRLDFIGRIADWFDRYLH